MVAALVGTVLLAIHSIVFKDEAKVQRARRRADELQNSIGNIVYLASSDRLRPSRYLLNLLEQRRAELEGLLPVLRKGYNKSYINSVEATLSKAQEILFAPV